MQKIFLIIFLVVYSNNQLLCNISLIEQKYYYAMNSLTKDTSSSINSSISDKLSENKKFKSPGKALLYSGILPGLGQAYMRNWMRGLLFIALDGVAIATRYQNINSAEEKKKEYIYYAEDHWDLSRWIHDYYKWFEYKEGNDNWNAIREVFINSSDTLSQCDEDPSQGQCYVEIMDNSHAVEFFHDNDSWPSSPIKSNTKEFKKIFEDLCGNLHHNKRCVEDIELIAAKLVESEVVINSTHHFYEGIQKYDMFFAGWDDNDSVQVISKSTGEKNATSSNQKTYRSLWRDYNRIQTLAVSSGKFMLINRVVSMVDALFLAKKWNEKNNIKLSLNTYPDLRNNFGLGGITLSINW